MSTPEIVLIAAVATSNRVIGVDNKLPWHVPADLKRFKRLTSGYPLIMGRRTFDSLIQQFGGPLPDRRHVVLTRNPETVTHPAAECFGSLEQAMSALNDEERVFIGGGEAVYGATIEKADRLELTFIDGTYEGDAYFPPFRHLIGVRYRLSAREDHDGFRFCTYLRI